MGSKATKCSDNHVADTVRSYCQDLIEASEVDHYSRIKEILVGIDTMLREMRVEYLRELVVLLKNARAQHIKPEGNDSKKAHKNLQIKSDASSRLGEFPKILSSKCLNSDDQGVRTSTLSMYVALASPLPSCYDSNDIGSKTVVKRTRNSLLHSLKIILGGKETFGDFFAFVHGCEDEEQDDDTREKSESKYAVIDFAGGVSISVERSAVSTSFNSKWTCSVNDRCLAFRALEALIRSCPENQSAARCTGVLRMMNSFLNVPNEAVELFAVRCLDSILCEFNLPAACREGIFVSITRYLALELSEDSNLLPSKRAIVSETRRLCRAVKQKLLSRASQYPMLGHSILSASIRWGNQMDKHGRVDSSGLSVLLAILSARLNVSGATGVALENYTNATFEAQVRRTTQSLDSDDCGDVVDVAAAISSCICSNVVAAAEILRGRVLPAAKTWFPVNKVFGGEPVTQSDSVVVTGNRFLLVALRVLNDAARRLRDEKKPHRGAAAAALWILNAVIRVQHHYERRRGSEPEVGDIVRVKSKIPAARQKMGIVLSINDTEGTVRVKLRKGGQRSGRRGALTKTFPRARVQSMVRLSFLNTFDDETLGFKGMNEIFALAPELVTMSARETDGISFVPGMQENVVAHETHANLALSRTLKALAFDIAFDLRRELSKCVWVPAPDGLPSRQTSFVRSIEALYLSTTRKSLQGVDVSISDQMVRFSRIHTLINSTLIHSFAMLSLCVEGGSDDDSWGCKLRSESLCKCTLEMMMRRAIRSSLRWRDELRRERAANLFGDPSETEMDEDKEAKSIDASVSTCCGGGASRAVRTTTLHRSTDISGAFDECRIDALCFVALSTVFQVHASSGVPTVQTHIGRSVQGAFDDVSKSALPSKLFRRTAQDGSNVFDVLYMGIEVWNGEADTESKVEIKQRIEKDIVRFLKGDAHPMLWQYAYLSRGSRKESPVLRIRNSVRALQMIRNMCAHPNASRLWGCGPLRSLEVSLDSTESDSSSGPRESLDLPSLIDRGLSTLQDVMHRLDSYKDVIRRRFIDPYGTKGAEALIAAVESDDTVLIDQLIENEGDTIDPNACRASDGKSAIHVAAIRGRPLTLAILLEKIATRHPDEIPFRPCYADLHPKVACMQMILGGGSASKRTRASPEAFDECFEKLCRFSDVHKLAGRGPSSSIFEETTRILVASLLRIALRSCTEIVESFMNHATRQNKALSGEVFELLEPSIVLATWALRMDRAGPRCQVDSVRLIEAITRYPVFHDCRMLLWITTEENAQMRLRQTLDSKWRNFAGCERSYGIVDVHEVGDEDVAKVTLRIVHLQLDDKESEDDRNDDFFIQIARDFTIEDVRISIIRALDFENVYIDDCKLDVFLNGRVYRSKKRRTGKDKSANIDREDSASVSPFVSDYCTVAYALTSTGKRMRKSQVVSSNRGLSYSIDDQSKLSSTDISSLLSRRRRLTKRRSGAAGSSDSESRSRSALSNVENDGSAVSTANARLCEELQVIAPNKRLTPPFQPPSFDSWQVQSRMRIVHRIRSSTSAVSEDVPVAWSIMEFETCSPRQTWHVILVEAALESSAQLRGVGVGLLRGDEHLKWDGRTAKAWRSFDVRDNSIKSREKFAKYFPWLQKLFVVPVDAVSRKKAIIGNGHEFYLNVKRKKTAVADDVNVTASFGRSISFSDIGPKWPGGPFVVRAVRACDELDLLRQFKPTDDMCRGGMVRDFALLECKGSAHRMLYFNSNGDPPTELMTRTHAKLSSQLFVSEFRFWDNADMYRASASDDIAAQSLSRKIDSNMNSTGLVAPLDLTIENAASSISVTKSTNSRRYMDAFKVHYRAIEMGAVSLLSALSKTVRVSEGG